MRNGGPPQFFNLPGFKERRRSASDKDCIDLATTEQSLLHLNFFAERFEVGLDFSISTMLAFLEEAETANRAAKRDM